MIHRIDQKNFSVSGLAKSEYLGFKSCMNLCSSTSVRFKHFCMGDNPMVICAFTRDLKPLHAGLQRKLVVIDVAFFLALFLVIADRKGPENHRSQFSLCINKTKPSNRPSSIY